MSSEAWIMSKHRGAQRRGGGCLPAHFEGGMRPLSSVTFDMDAHAVCLGEIDKGGGIAPALIRHVKGTVDLADWR